MPSDNSTALDFGRSKSSDASRPHITEEVLKVVGDHAVRQLLPALAHWLRDGVDLTALLTFKWRLLGALKSPVQLWVIAPDPARTFDAVVKVLCLRPAGVETVSQQPSAYRIQQLCAEAEVVVIPPSAKHSVADRFLEGIGSGCINAATIVIANEAPRRLATGPRLAMAAPTRDNAFPTRQRSYQFGSFTGVVTPAQSKLANLLVVAARPEQKIIDWGELHISDLNLSGEHFPIVNALVSVTVWLKCQLAGMDCLQAEPGDYRLVRRLLQAVPVATKESILPPLLAGFADDLFASLSERGESEAKGDYPYLATTGIKEATKFTGVSTNTASKYLKLLVAKGFMKSCTVTGKRSYEGFQFNEHAAPPFDSVNPFLDLPDLA